MGLPDPYNVGREMGRITSQIELLMLKAGEISLKIDGISEHIYMIKSEIIGVENRLKVQENLMELHIKQADKVKLNVKKLLGVGAVMGGMVITIVNQVMQVVD